MLSIRKRKWSIEWLQELCQRYRGELDLLEGHLHRLPEAVPASHGVGLEWANDITALWDIAHEVARNRSPCPRPARKSVLNFNEVKDQVERLMS